MNWNFRGRLHGEFQPGLRLRPTHLAEIFLRLYGEFQPGEMYKTDWAGQVCRKAFSIHKFIFQPGRAGFSARLTSR